MNLKILLVEDDSDIRAILKKACQFEKITVLEAETCETASALFRREKPELVYVDIFLASGEIGLDLIPEFCGPSVSQRPKIVVSSGEIGKDVFNTLGFNQPDKVDLFVLKPFDPKDLVSKILKLAKTPTPVKPPPAAPPPPAPKTQPQIPKATQAPEASASPQTARECFIVGLRKFSADDMEGALQMFSKAIDLDPKHAGAYSYRAFCRDRLGDKAGAGADFESCQNLGGF